MAIIPVKANVDGGWMQPYLRVEEAHPGVLSVGRIGTHQRWENKCNDHEIQFTLRHFRVIYRTCG